MPKSTKLFSGVRLLLLVAALALVFGIKQYFSSPSQPASDTASASVITSIPAIASLLHSVMGSGACQVQIKVVNTVTVGHSFELTPYWVNMLRRAELIVMVGGGLDDWMRLSGAQQVLSFEQLGVMRAVSALLRGSGAEKEMLDPHFWLDPVLVGQHLDELMKEIYRVFAHRCVLSKLQDNVARLRDDISRLLDEILFLFRQSGVKQVIATHDAYRYLIRLLSEHQVQIAYEGLNEHHIGSRQLLRMIEVLRSRPEARVWDFPPFSTCNQLEQKLGAKQPRCARLDHSGHVMVQHNSPEFGYDEFYRHFLKDF